MFLFVMHVFNFIITICFYVNVCQQVQDIEFMQIEMKVIEGLKVGNDCLKSMHEVDILLYLFSSLFVLRNRLFPLR